MSDSGSRTAALHRVAQAVGFSHEEDRVTESRRFCMRCGAEMPYESGVPTFACSRTECRHVDTRAYTFTRETRFRIAPVEPTGELGLYHYSVGCLVFAEFDREDERRVLLLRR